MTTAFDNRFGPVLATALGGIASVVFASGCGGGLQYQTEAANRAARIKSLPAATDNSDVAIMIAALEDEDIGWVAWEKLRRRTNQAHGSAQTPEGRRIAADGWRNWLAQQSVSPVASPQRAALGAVGAKPQKPPRP